MPMMSLPKQSKSGSKLLHIYSQYNLQILNRKIDSHVSEDELQEPEIDDKNALYKVPGSPAPPGESDKGSDFVRQFTILELAWPIQFLNMPMINDLHLSLLVVKKFRKNFAKHFAKLDQANSNKIDFDMDEEHGAFEGELKDSVLHGLGRHVKLDGSCWVLGRGC